MPSFSSVLKSVRTHTIVILVFLLLALGYDLLTPRGYTDWVLYLLAVLLTMRVPDGLPLLFVASLASAFTVLGAALSPPGQPLWLTVVSRSMGLVLIWTAVSIAFRWRRADDRLRRLEKAVSGSGEIVFMTDAQGIITFVNPAFSATYGYAPEEVVGNTTPRILKSGRMTPEAYKTFWGALLGRRAVQTEIVNKTRDGRLVTVEASASAIVDERGNITGFLALQRDITERKRAEEEVRKSAASLAEAQRIAHVGNWEWDIAQDRAWWSEEMYRIFGVDPSGPTPTLEASLKLMHPQDREEVEAAVNEAMEKGQPYARDYRIVRPDGVERRVHAEGEVTFDGQRRPVRMVGIVQDITEHRRAEERMRSLEHRFSLAFNAGPEPMTISSLAKAIYVDVNDAFLQVTGYRREEVIGRSSLALRFWAVPEQRRALLEELKQGPVRDFEITFLTKSGERRTGLLSAETIEVEGERCLLATTKDITQRKRAEEELKRANRALRTISECNQAMVRAIEEPDLLKEICRILVEHGGYRMAWVGFMAEDEARSVRPVAWAGQEQGYLASLKVTWADEPRGHGPTGTAIRTGQPCVVHDTHADPNFTPWRDEARQRGFAAVIGLPLITGGRTLGALSIYSAEPSAFDAREMGLLRELADDLAYGIGTLRDRGERRRAEAALREYEKVVESTQDMMMVVDRNYRFRIANRAFLAYRGLEPGQVIGRTVKEILGEEVFEQVIKDKLDQCFQDKVVRFEMSLTYPEMGERNLALAYYPIEGPGGVDRAACILRDITEKVEAERTLKKTQEQFLQAQKMEAVGRLAGGVAHDFNNLLTVINGYADLMLSRFPAESLERNQLEEIRKAGDRAAGLTRQLLAFSRKQVVRPAVLDLNRIVEGMATMLQRLVGEDVQFSTHLMPSLGRIKADAGQIEQVLMNLAVNARDAMPKGGKLSIATTNLDLDESFVSTHPYMEPGSYVMLSFSDTGCGMDQETLSHIFEPFFTTKAPGHGTGLGLSTVFGIVKQSGGFVNVYSEVGRGTTFKIFLKHVQEAPGAEAAEVLPAASTAGTETILLVEDEPAVRAMAEQALRSGGYNVLVAGEYIEALAHSARHSGAIHLLVTDVIMPGLNGRELADCVHALRPDTRVLFISGYTADAIADQRILEENFAFLSKPFTPRELLRKVRETLDGK